MTIRTYVSQSLLVAMMAAAGASWAHAYPVQPQQTGGVSYLSGGIGDEERNAMQSVKDEYNLSMVSALSSGAYVGDTRVVISDADGDTLINTQAGPIFYAQLPPGRYTVQASSQGQTRTSDIVIGQNEHKHLHFSWR